MSRISRLEIDDSGLPAPTPEIEQDRRVAMSESLQAHGLSVRARLEALNEGDR